MSSRGCDLPHRAHTIGHRRGDTSTGELDGTFGLCSWDVVTSHLRLTSSASEGETLGPEDTMAQLSGLREDLHWQDNYFFLQKLHYSVSSQFICWAVFVRRSDLPPWAHTVGLWRGDAWTRGHDGTVGLSSWRPSLARQLFFSFKNYIVLFPHKWRWSCQWRSSWRQPNCCE